MKYKITGVITLEDGAEIENPIFEIADNTMYQDGEVIIQVHYYSGATQTIPTLSRFYEFDITGNTTHTRQDCIDKILAHSIHSGNVPL